MISFGAGRPPSIKGCLRDFAQSERTGRVGEKQGISAWEITMCHPLWKGRGIIPLQPLTMERTRVIHHIITPTTHFICHPFITLIYEPGWRIPSALWSTWAAAGDVRAGTPGRGMGRKEKWTALKLDQRWPVPMLLWDFILALPTLTSFFVTQFFVLCANSILFFSLLFI